MTQLSDLIPNFERLHQVGGRTAWKYLPQTEKQRGLLSSLASRLDTSRLDRGAAAMLINHLLKLQSEAAAMGRYAPGDGREMGGDSDCWNGMEDFEQ